MNRGGRLLSLREAERLLRAAIRHAERTGDTSRIAAAKAHVDDVKQRNTEYEVGGAA